MVLYDSLTVGNCVNYVHNCEQSLTFHSQFFDGALTFGIYITNNEIVIRLSLYNVVTTVTATDTTTTQTVSRATATTIILIILLIIML